MITRPVLLDDVAAPKDLDQVLERRPRCCCLGDGELVLDLPAEEAPGIAHDRDRETAFAVDEADDPLLETWPFLLIDRTGHIVTSIVDCTLTRATDNFGSAGYSVFPAYSQLLLRDRSRNGQTRSGVMPRAPTLGWL